MHPLNQSLVGELCLQFAQQRKIIIVYQQRGYVMKYIWLKKSPLAYVLLCRPAIVATVSAAIFIAPFSAPGNAVSAQGKPFQELNALIQENATAIDENGNLIEVNSDAILALNSQLSLLDGRVGVLETSNLAVIVGKEMRQPRLPLCLKIIQP